AGEAALARFLAACVGREHRVLVETGTEGRTEQFAPARLLEPLPPGSLARARAEAVADGALLARPMGEAA
ncbi:MAG: tRNA (N(6)-L-threonylcarbamoyladenosine(37)-C(2))-methylthiotransferase MtaB, partial [Alphaproteobacteria bacterium]